MNVGELFVSLGVKGTDKAVGAISGVKKGLSDTKDMSLEAKAGILGVLYALERLVAGSNQTGAELTNMSTVLGISTEQLQQYKWAAQQAHVANTSVTASFLALQSAMTKMMTEGSGNKWLSRVMQLTGTTTAEMAELQKHPEQLMAKLQKYASIEKNKGLLREVLSAFGLDTGMIAAMEQQAFTPEKLDKAKGHGYTEGEVGALSKNEVDWANLGTKFEVGIGKLNAKFGGKMVHDIDLVSTKVLALVTSFTLLADKIHLIEGIGLIFEGWGKIFDGLIKVVDAFSDPKKMAEIKKNITEFFSAGGGIGSAIGAAADMIPGVNGDKVAAALNGNEPPIDTSTRPATQKELEGMSAPYKPSTPAPPPPSTPPKPETHASAEVNQTLNFYDHGRDPQKTATTLKTAMRNAFRQTPSLSRIT